MKLTVEQRNEIKEAMANTSYKHKTINGVDHYINAAVKEGIEMKGDKINPYAIDSGDKVYGYDRVGDTTRRAVEVIEQVLSDLGIEGKSIPTMDQVVDVDIIPPELGGGEIVPTDDQLYGIMPHNLTEKIIKKHPGSQSILIGLQKTDPKYVKTITDKSGNPVLKNGRKTSYVEGNFMKMEANLAFLFNWDVEVLDFSEYDYEFTALVQCTFRFTEGYTVIKTQEGGADKKFSKTLKDHAGHPRMIMVADTKKAAITDGVKRCIADLGINDDVYRGENDGT